MRIGLVAVIVGGLLLALFPVIVNLLDLALYKEKQISVVSTTGGVKILVPQVESHIGADRLVVSPGKAIVPPNTTINVIIRVYFRHSQPCPYSDWHVDYSVKGNLKIVSDNGGRLVSPKVYERVLKVKVLGNGVITVTYHYGSGCSEGTIEQVKVELLTSTKNVSSTETETSTTITESEKYVNISGIVELKDVTRRILRVSGKIVYVRGRWIAVGSNQVLRSIEVIEKIPIHSYVTVLCKLSESGELQAIKITVDNKVTYVRSQYFNTS